MLAGARRAFELKDRMEVSEELGMSSNYQGGIGVPKPGKRGNPGFDGGIASVNYRSGRLRCRLSGQGERLAQDKPMAGVRLNRLEPCS